MSTSIERQIGRYRILRLLAEGGMASVYLARQDPLGRLVVLKTPHDSQARGAVGRIRIQDALRAEAEVQVGLIHPHILPLLDYHFEADAASYLVSPYVPEGSLVQFLRLVADAELPAAPPPLLAAAMVGQAAAALQYAHDRGIIHCDIKPANILVHLMEAAHVPPCSSGHGAIGPRAAPRALQRYPYVLIADFGVARLVFDQEVGVATGTPRYAAPELTAGVALPASDQYALACVAYWLLTGCHAFEGSGAGLAEQHRCAPPPRASSVNAALPAAVDGVLARALAKEPAARYAHVADFARALYDAVSMDGGAPAVGL